jgi:ribonuclease HI
LLIISIVLSKRYFPPSPVATLSAWLRKGFDLNKKVIEKHRGITKVAQKKYYAVARGRKTGIFDKWFGQGGAWEQVNGHAGAIFKGFPNQLEAETWFSGMEKITAGAPSAKTRPNPTKNSSDKSAPVPENTVIVYTDGGSLGNPGPGGYGAVMLYSGERKELSGAFRLTTNNRMEMMACIVALRELKTPSSVIMYCDSKYVVDGMTKGWAVRWRSKGWMRTKTEKAKNVDLWAELLNLCERHNVEFRWVKGHAGVAENERCDFLVNREQARTNLPADEIYEKEIAGKD